MTMLSDKICVPKPVFVVPMCVYLLVKWLTLRFYGVRGGSEKEVHP